MPNTEGSYIYSCPMPEEKKFTLPEPFNPPKGYIELGPDVQNLIDTIEKQREEIVFLKHQAEAFKQAIELLKSYMTEKQLLSISYMAKLLTEEKK